MTSNNVQDDDSPSALAANLSQNCSSNNNEMHKDKLEVASNNTPNGVKEPCAAGEINHAFEISDDDLISKLAVEVLETEDIRTTTWRDSKHRASCLQFATGTVKGLILLGLLYVFVCSLDLLSSSLQLLGGRTTGSILAYPIFENPIGGLLIGIVATAILQSSSTSTSIVVSLVSAGYFSSIKIAIPIIMGANVGTSITNTIVAILRISKTDEFGRAFTGATVHDMFNMLSVLVYLPLEMATDYLYHLTQAIMDSIDWENSRGKEVKLIKVITDPLTKSILWLDKKVLEGWAVDDPKFENATLMKIWCDVDIKCASLFSYIGLDDSTSGAIMTVVSVAMLIASLLLLCKLLDSILQGALANILKQKINADIPYVPWITGYVAMIFGAVATTLLQSSSVFTSALTPLVGSGIISLNRVYPLTLGSNIGTTTTAILAALTAPPDKLRDTLQIAFCHLFFNISGILLFYPIPFMRWPIPLAKGLGTCTAKYKWFAFAYLLGPFILIPIFILGLSVLDSRGIVLLVVIVPIIAIIVLILVINFLRKRFPMILPSKFRTWNWLPLWMRSLQPIDKIMRVVFPCQICRSDDYLGEEPSDSCNI